MHGLLKIRGEISKSDVVAGLLATKCVQEKVAEVLQVSWWPVFSRCFKLRVVRVKKKQVGFFLQPLFFLHHFLELGGIFLKAMPANLVLPGIFC